MFTIVISELEDIVLYIKNKIAEYSINVDICYHQDP